MSRKWKIVLGVLAVIIVFCLWYTRPRSFDQLVGDKEFQNFSMVAITMGNKGGKMVSDSWQLDSYEGREKMNGALREILQSCQYRVSLKSLLPFPDTSSHSLPRGEDSIIINLAVGLEDGSSVFALYVGTTVTLSADGAIAAKATDREIGQKLLAFVQENGWKTDS